MNSEKLIEQAMLLFKEEDFLQAANLFHQAAEEFLQSGDQLKAAEARNNQGVALLQAGKPAEALAALTGTDLVFKAAGDNSRQAQALGNQAAAHQSLGHLEQAAVLYLQSAEILKSIGQDEYYTLVMKNVSSIRMKQRRFLDSLFAMNQALSGKKKLTFQERMIKSLSNFAFRMFSRPPVQ